MSGINRQHVARVLDARESHESPLRYYRKPVLANPPRQVGDGSFYLGIVCGLTISLVLVISFLWALGVL